MNCSTVEQLLPLYIEGDLTHEREREVLHHLSFCELCQQLANEYRASQSWLRLYDPPEFDAAFYGGIRRAVLDEIERSAPVRFSFIRNFLPRRRVAFAASIALMIVAGALALVAYRDGVQLNEPHAPEASDSKFGPDVPKPSAVFEKPRSTFGPDKVMRIPSTATNDVLQRRSRPVRLLARRPRRQSFPDSRAESPGLALNETLTTLSQGRGTNKTTATFIGEQPATEVATTRGADDTVPEMLRIELQTGDPNIRIIWLSAKAAAQHRQ